MKVNIQLLEIPSPERSKLYFTVDLRENVWNCTKWMSNKTFLQNEAALGFLVTSLLESQFPAILQGLGGPEEGGRSMSVSQVNALIHIHTSVCVCVVIEKIGPGVTFKRVCLPKFPSGQIMTWQIGGDEHDEKIFMKKMKAIKRKFRVLLLRNPLSWYLTKYLISEVSSEITVTTAVFPLLV